MTEPLVTKLRNPGQASYYTFGWINCVEDHLIFLQDPGNGEVYRPTGMERSRYQGRFYAFLRDVVKMDQPQYFYPYLRANNMTAPDQFGEKHDLLIFPDITKIEQIYTRYTASLPTQ